jgi:superfamily II DNA/RNA helicase
MNTQVQMAQIIDKIPEDTQRVFCSATVTTDALSIANSYFRPYSIEMSIGRKLVVLLDDDDYTLDQIRQYYVVCQNQTDKENNLRELLSVLKITQGIIFANKIETADHLRMMLSHFQFPIPTAIFHGKLSGVERESIFTDFRKGRYRLLIATDVASRGLNVDGINVVINFDMPNDLPTYIHRVGRSGRHGRKGTAISFILHDGGRNREMEKVDNINECSQNSKMTALPDRIDDLL